MRQRVKFVLGDLLAIWREHANRHSGRRNIDLGILFEDRNRELDRRPMRIIGLRDQNRTRGSGFRSKTWPPGWIARGFCTTLYPVGCAYRALWAAKRMATSMSVEKRLSIASMRSLVSRGAGSVSPN